MATREECAARMVARAERYMNGDFLAWLSVVLKERDEAERRSAWQERLLSWCRPRLRNQYSGTLDSYIAAGVTDAPTDAKPSAYERGQTIA